MDLISTKTKSLGENNLMLSEKLQKWEETIKSLETQAKVSAKLEESEMETLKWSENFENTSSIKEQIHYFKNAFKASLFAWSNLRKKVTENEQLIKDTEEKRKISENRMNSKIKELTKVINKFQSDTSSKSSNSDFWDFRKRKFIEIENDKDWDSQANSIKKNPLQLEQNLSQNSEKKEIFKRIKHEKTSNWIDGMFSGKQNQDETKSKHKNPFRQNVLLLNSSKNSLKNNFFNK